MLPSFRITNLQSKASDYDDEKHVVQLTGPTYDFTVSSNPRATLKYNDEEGDLVTVGGDTLRTVSIC